MDEKIFGDLPLTCYGERRLTARNSETSPVIALKIVVLLGHCPQHIIDDSMFLFFIQLTPIYDIIFIFKMLTSGVDFTPIQFF